MTRFLSLVLQLWFFATAPMRRFAATDTAESVAAIDYALLRRAGITLLVFDLDDTLTVAKGPLTSSTRELLGFLKRSGFSVSILTNSREKRATVIAKDLASDGIPVVTGPYKPLVGGLRRTLALHNTKPEHAAMIGDRVSTDMWGAQRAGLKKRILLTRPYPGASSPSQRFLRGAEKILCRRAPKVRPHREKGE